jgi:hypothetical protein
MTGLAQTPKSIRRIPYDNYKKNKLSTYENPHEPRLTKCDEDYWGYHMTIKK